MYNAEEVDFWLQFLNLLPYLLCSYLLSNIYFTYQTTTTANLRSPCFSSNVLPKVYLLSKRKHSEDMYDSRGIYKRFYLFLYSVTVRTLIQSSINVIMCHFLPDSDVCLLILYIDYRNLPHYTELWILKGSIPILSTCST